jgi:hypothetical protein
MYLLIYNYNSMHLLCRSNVRPGFLWTCIIMEVGKSMRTATANKATLGRSVIFFFAWRQKKKKKQGPKWIHRVIWNKREVPFPAYLWQLMIHPMAMESISSHPTKGHGRISCSSKQVKTSTIYFFIQTILHEFKL